MTPLPVSGILYLLQAGFPAENVLRAGVIDVRQKSPKDRDAAVLAFHPTRETPEAARFRQLLGVGPSTRVHARAD